LNTKLIAVNLKSQIIEAQVAMPIPAGTCRVWETAHANLHLSGVGFLIFT